VVYVVGCDGVVVRGQTVVGATLSGVIRDPAGAVVAGARVEVQSVETGRVTVGVSDEEWGVSSGSGAAGAVSGGGLGGGVSDGGDRECGVDGGAIGDVERDAGGAVTEQVEVRGGGVALVKPTKTEVNTVYGAADFIGPVPRRFRDGIAGAVPSFGQPGVTGPARQVQLALRINF